MGIGMASSRVTEKNWCSISAMQTNAAMAGIAECFISRISFFGDTRVRLDYTHLCSFVQKGSVVENTASPPNILSHDNRAPEHLSCRLTPVRIGDWAGKAGSISYQFHHSGHFSAS